MYRILPVKSGKKGILYVRIQNHRHLCERNSSGCREWHHPFGRVCAGMPRLYPSVEPGLGRHAGGGGHLAAGRHSVSRQGNFLPGSAGKGATGMAHPRRAQRFPLKVTAPRGRRPQFCLLLPLCLPVQGNGRRFYRWNPLSS